MKRRTLIESEKWPNGQWRGGRGRVVWRYGYPELARLLGMSEDAVRKAVSRGRFDPADLADVVRYLREREG